MDRISSSNSSVVPPEKELITFLKTKIESSDDHDFATLLRWVPQEERVQFCKDSLNLSQALVTRWIQHFDKKHYCGNRKTESIVIGVTGSTGVISIITSIGLLFADVSPVVPVLIASIPGFCGGVAAMGLASNSRRLDHGKQVIIDSQNYIQQCLKKYIPQEPADASEQDQNESATSNLDEMV